MKKPIALLKNLTLSSLVLLTMAACSSDVSYAQKESPARLYKDYREDATAVVGVGTPISQRQMRANAVMEVTGDMSLEDMMARVASVYNLAIRWDDSVRRNTRKKVMVNKLTFDESRSYIEDVYEVQIVREGERRLFVMPSLDEARIESFKPGTSVTLSQLVRGLAEQCGYNVVITENKRALSKTLVTTSFNDVSCLDAFDAVLTPHGLSLQDNGDFFTIGGFPQRQWLLDLYEPNRIETQEVSYSSDIAGEGDGTEISAGGKGSLKIENNRDLWSELEEDLSDLIDKSCATLKDNRSEATNTFNSAAASFDSFDSSTASRSASSSYDDEDDDGSFECGYVRVNRTVGLVQMRAPQSVLTQADEIIRHVEDVASRRLLVEARIIGVSRKRAFEQGANLSTGSDIDGARAGFTSAGENVTVATAINNALAGITGTGFGGGFAVQAGDLEAAVRIAESFGTTYQLMQPTIEVMDRQRAVMIDGRNEKYFLIESTVETTDVGSLTTKTAEQKTQFVGIQFGVTAQVAEPGEPHTLHIQVPITEIDRFVEVPDDSNSEVPVVTTRVIDQKVRLRDGEVKVIGGLTRTLALDNESGVPLMRNMPIAGAFLGDENVSFEQVEFIVLLQAKRLY